MEPYENLSSRSGVVAYEAAFDSIAVQFRDGSVYLYTNASAGAGNISHMKSLARRGHGLNAFINRSVKDSYARRLR